MLSGDGTVVNSLTVYFIHAVVIKISAGGRSGPVSCARAHARRGVKLVNLTSPGAGAATLLMAANAVNSQ